MLERNSVAVIAGADLKYRSGAVFYEFHQNPDFFYLTGFNEPEAVAVIGKKVSVHSSSRCSLLVEKYDDKESKFHLFVRPKDEKAELWEGARSGTQAALDVFNADEAYDINKVEKLLPDLLTGKDHVYTDLPNEFKLRSNFSRYFGGLPKAPSDGFAKLLQSCRDIQPLRPWLNRLRAIKSSAEILNMRKAGRASGRAFTAAMRQSYSLEKELGAFLDSMFKLNGCDGPAYVPVIAGGKNALSIHYVRNDDTLEPDELILADAGGEYGGYITDITRTWPNGGVFSSAQRDLYEVVLKVQRSCISLCREDANMSLDKIHKVAENGLRDGLKQLGFDTSGPAVDTLFPHHVGHYIGLDVHDSPGYSRREILKEGHCITIEPGIYVPENDRWPKAFRGMGIRIEDSVGVQKESPLIFTTEAVKEVSTVLN